MDWTSFRPPSSRGLRGPATALRGWKARCAQWLVASLLCLMPVQFTWAAVASYCLDEASASAAPAHVGHHAHQHGPAAQAEHAQAGAGTSTHAPDTDCHHCHVAVAPFAIAHHSSRILFLPPRQTLQPVSAPFTSWVRNTIDRPKWPLTGTAGMAWG